MATATMDLVHYERTGIDCKTVGNMTIFTTGGGPKFIPTAIICTMEAASGLSVGAVVSAGVTGSNYNDIMTAQTLGTAADRVLPFALSALFTAIQPNTAFVVRVATAAVGTSGTFRCDVWGFYQ